MPPDPPRFLGLRRSVVSKTVRIFPRFAPVNNLFRKAKLRDKARAKTKQTHQF